MLKQRILTAIVGALLLFGVLFALPPDIARGVIAAVIVFAAWEWAAFPGLSGAAARTGYALLVGAALAGLYAAVAASLVSPAAVFLLAIGWWGFALLWIVFRPASMPRAIAFLAGPVVLLPAWLALDLLYHRDPSLLLFMLIIVFAADVGAFFAGKRFGRVKLAPAISPGKTWEGVIGGVLLVALLSAGGAAWFGIPAAALVPFCMAIGLTSVIGDLTVSVFKRAAGIKDSGTLFPGHGGLLDRIDSVTAAAPLFAIGVSWAGW